MRKGESESQREKVKVDLKREQYEGYLAGKSMDRLCETLNVQLL